MNNTLAKPTLRLGDRLDAPVYGSLRQGSKPVLLLASGQRIETVQQLQMLRVIGFAVILPSEEGNGLTVGAVDRDAKQTLAPSSDFESRLECGNKIRLAVKEAARDLYERVLTGQQPDYNRLLQASVQVANEVTADPHAYAALTFLRMCDDYTVEHSADVAILMVAMARVLEVPEKDLQDVALAGLMHDVGKQLVPQGIIQKPGTLTDDEYAQIRRHPEYGLSILTDIMDCPDAVREVAMQHHERLDGSGYPGGHDARPVHQYSLIAAAADVFDAMTSKRVYSQGKPARAALKELYSARGKLFDPGAIDALVKLIGVYPVGTRVRLNTGERGVVVAPNYEDSTRPVVEINTHPDGRPLSFTYRKLLNGSSCSIVASEL